MYLMCRILCVIRVGWWISKVGDIGVKWKLLGIETAVVKGFFSKIIILDNKWLLKIAKKMRKCIFLFNGPELERVLVFRPPLFFDFRGGHTSSILSNSYSFLRYAFLGLRFTFHWFLAVSIPKSFHLAFSFGTNPNVAYFSSYTADLRFYNFTSNLRLDRYYK